GCGWGRRVGRGGRPSGRGCGREPAGQGPGSAGSRRSSQVPLPSVDPVIRSRHSRTLDREPLVGRGQYVAGGQPLGLKAVSVEPPVGHGCSHCSLYPIWVHVYAVRLSDDPSAPCPVGWIAGGDTRDVVAPSFGEFL